MREIGSFPGEPIHRDIGLQKSKRPSRTPAMNRRHCSAETVKYPAERCFESRTAAPSPKLPTSTQSVSCADRVDFRQPTGCAVITQ